MRTILLLAASNLFMNLAWYWHVKVPADKWPLWGFIAVSWLIALPEYCLAVPANRFGHVSQGGPFTTAQLKVLQEGLTIAMFLLVLLAVHREAPRWRDLGAMALIVAGVAVAMSGRTTLHPG